MAIFIIFNILRFMKYIYFPIKHKIVSKNENLVFGI